MKMNKTQFIKKEIIFINIKYIANEGKLKHVMLTTEIKISKSAVALKRISQLRRPGISNSVHCQ